MTSWMGGGVEDDGVGGVPGDEIEHVAEQADEILPGGDGADRPGQDVIEHQRADGEFGEPAADGALDDFVNAAAGEHRAAFHVHGGDRIAEEHDAEDEPGRGLADGLLADAADVIGGAGQIAEDDGGGPPEADERQRNAADDQHVYFIAKAGIGKLGVVENVRRIFSLHRRSPLASAMTELNLDAISGKFLSENAAARPRRLNDRHSRIMPEFHGPMAVLPFSPVRMR